MASLQAKIFYSAMKLFFRRIIPAEASIERLRRGTSANRSLEPLPRGVRWENGAVGGVIGEWIMPENAASDRVLLYLHGGGFVTKSPAVHRIFVAKLAQGADVHAFVADYRLAPENPFPAALDDAETAYRGLLERGIPPNQITIAGDSAGGNLAAALLLKLRDSGQPLPACAALISALIDCTLPDADLAELEKYDPMLNRVQGKTWIQHYSQDHDLTDPLISPIFGDLSKLPPLLIHVGDHEILLSQTKRFAQKAQAAGVNTTLKVWEGMIHVFPLFAGFLPEGKTAIREISAFFRAHLN